MIATVRAFFFRSLAIQKRYFLDYSLGLLIKIFFFTAVIYNSRGSNQQPIYVAGFLLWYLSSHLLARMANFFLEESYLGTLARLLASPHKPVSLIAAMSITELLVSVPWVLALAVYSLFCGVPALHLGAREALVLLFGIVGVWGIGLTLLAASLRFKQVGSLTEMLTFYLLLFSGFFVESSKLPGAVHLINAANPLYQAISDINNGGYIKSALVALFWLTVGLGLFNALYARARKDGSLLNY